MKRALRAAAGTDTGKQREHNEDAYLCEPEEGFFAVIDGVGGYAGGEVAAALAREAIRRRLQNRTGSPEERLRQAVTNANNTIYWRSQEEPELADMACVLTVALLEGDDLYIAHVGDTRLYKSRTQRLVKITRDHSFIGAQEDQQVLSEYDAMHHPRRNEILRDVGSELHALDDEDFIDIDTVPFEPDCALLLCSDGLTDLVPARTLQRLLAERAGTPHETTTALIRAANDAGGTDNITVVVIEGPDFGGASPVLPSTARQTLPSHKADPQPLPATDAPTGSFHGRSYGYGIVTTLAILAVFYAAWTYGPFSTPPPPPSPEVVAPDSLPGRINALLAAAQPGDTVVIEAGDYRETIRLRSGITVQSASADTVRLLPPFNPTPGDTIAVLAEDVTDAVLIGFHIGPDTTDTGFAIGLLARRASVRIERLTIMKTTHAGVVIDADATREAGVTLQHSRILNNGGAGVIVGGNNESVHITHNEITTNGGVGVMLLEEARLTLNSNTILNNEGGDIAIRLDTTLARLRTMNTLTEDGANIRLLPDEIRP